jgi:hypothetical protein
MHTVHLVNSFALERKKLGARRNDFLSPTDLPRLAITTKPSVAAKTVITTFSPALVALTPTEPSSMETTQQGAEE